jgi:hypothetical protein
MKKTSKAKREARPQMTAVPAAVHERGWQYRPINNDTGFAPPFGTIRVCIGCNCLVAGGPVRCVRCARDLARIPSQETPRIERGSMPAPPPSPFEGEDGDDAAGRGATG